MLCQEGGTFLKESSGQRGRSTQHKEQKPKLMTSHDDLMIEGDRGHDLLCALASTHALTSCPQHSMSLTSKMTSSLEDDQKCEPDLTGDPLDLKMFNFTNWVKAVQLIKVELYSCLVLKIWTENLLLDTKAIFR